ncbi:MAG: hypothetical protein IJL26_05685 [Clostridia bacterium]|nr:hypothetical protein [Clostridia bacterium]
MIDVDVSALQMTTELLQSKRKLLLLSLSEAKEHLSEMRAFSSGRENVFAGMDAELHALENAVVALSAFVDCVQDALTRLQFAEKQAGGLSGDPFSGVFLKMRQVALENIKRSMTDIRFAPEEEQQ